MTVGSHCIINSKIKSILTFTILNIIIHDISILTTKSPNPLSAFEHCRKDIIKYEESTQKSKDPKHQFFCYKSGLLR